MYRVGVDLGGTNIVAGVINEEMKIIGRGKLKTNCPRAAEAILEDVAKAVEAAVIDAGITMNDVVSVGIGTPGSVNKKNGVIEYANNLAFDNVPARDILDSRRLSISTTTRTAPHSAKQRRAQARESTALSPSLSEPESAAVLS